MIAARSLQSPVGPSRCVLKWGMSKEPSPRGSDESIDLELSHCQTNPELHRGFPARHGGTPLSLDGFKWKTLLKWMMTGGTPILGNPHIDKTSLVVGHVAEKINIDSM